MSGIRSIVDEAKKCKQLAESVDSSEDLQKSSARVVRLLDDFCGYVEDIASPPSPHVGHIIDFTLKNDWQQFSVDNGVNEVFSCRMMSGRVEAQLLRMFVSMSGATRVLEIGMFTGCAALAMAEALPSHGSVVTCDINASLEKVVRKLTEKSPHGKKVEIKIGPALETLKSLKEDGRQFDFVFIDADKTNYANYYKFLMDSTLLAPGGTICCDNTLWGGRVFLPEDERDTNPSTQALVEFNQMVQNDERVYQVLLTNRDGILMIRRKVDMDVHS